MTLIHSEGNTRVAMISMLAQSCLNILLDWVFIKEMQMGIKGAALATLMAQAVATLYALTYYVRKSGYLQVHAANFIPDLKILKSIFAIGISQFAQTVATTAARCCWSTACLLTAAMLRSRLSASSCALCGSA